jgi:hypothetical protein
MRHLILTFSFLLSAFSLAAQTWPKDSTWNAQESGTWFSYSQTLYQDGSLTLNKTFIGTDSALAATKTTTARQRSATWASDARAVARIRKEITETIRHRDATRQQIGIDFLRAIQDEVAPSLTGASWELRTDTVRTIVFNVTAQGVLRYTVSGFQARQAHVLGDALRLERFLGSKDPTDLFRDGSVWRSLSGAVVLRPAGNNERSASRQSLAPPEPEAVAPSPTKTTTTTKRKRKQ